MCLWPPLLVIAGGWPVASPSRAYARPLSRATDRWARRQALTSGMPPRPSALATRKALQAPMDGYHGAYLFGAAVESSGPRERWACAAARFAETAVVPCLPRFGPPRFERTVTTLRRKRSDNPCWPERSVVINTRSARRFVVCAHRTQRQASRFHGLTERLRYDGAQSRIPENDGSGWTCHPLH